MEQYKVYILIALSLIIVLVIFLLFKNNGKSSLQKEIDKLSIRFNAIKSAPIAFKLSKAQTMAKRNEENISEVEEYFKRYETAQEHINVIQELFINLEDQVALRKLNEAKETIIEINTKMVDSEKEIEEIDTFLNHFQQEENSQREYSQKLKEEFRDLKLYINENIKNFTYANEGIEKKITECETLFSSSEEALYLNDYIKAKNDFLKIETIIKDLKESINIIPELLTLTRGIIPNLLDEVNKEIASARQKGIYTKHLELDEKITYVEKILKEDLKTLGNGETTDIKKHSLESKETLETILQELGKENEAYKEVDEVLNEVKDIIEKIKNLYAYVSGTYKQEKDRFGLDDIKPYLEEVQRKNRNHEKQYQALILAKQDITMAVSEILIKTNELKNKCDIEEKTLLTYKMKIDQTSADEQRAKEQLQKLQIVINEVKMKVEEYRLPTISNGYYDDTKVAKNYIASIKKLLEDIPIDTVKLNETLDSAIDYIYAFYNNVNNVVGMAIMVENAIVFGNKYRSTYPEADRELSKAEFCYINGEYTKALTIAISCMETLFPNMSDEKILENK